MMAFMFRLSQASKPDQGSAGLPVSEPQESHTSDPKCVMGESTIFELLGHVVNSEFGLRCDLAC